MTILKKINALYFFMILTLLTISIELYLIFTEKTIDFKYIQDTKVITQNFILIVISILGVLIAIHYVVFQVFRNRYPLENTRELLLNELNRCSKHYALNVIIAALIFIIKIDLKLFIFPYVLHSFYCFYFCINAIQKFAQMDSTKLLDKYKQDVISAIKKKPIVLSDINAYADRINQLNEDSFSKQEIIVCNYNLKICEEVNIYFLEERDGFILNGIKEDDLKQVQTIFFATILNSMKYAISYNNDQYVEKSISSIITILRSCIDCDKYEVFEGLIEKTDKFFNYNQVRNNVRPCVSIIKLYWKLFDYVAIKNKRDEWIEFFISHFNLYTLKSTVHFDETIIRTICSSYFGVLEEFVNKRIVNHYENHLLNLISYLFQVVRGDSPGGIEKYVQLLIAQHTNLIVESKSENHIELYSKQLIRLSEFAIEYNNEELYTFLAITINNIISKSDNFELINTLNQSKHGILLKLLNSDREFSTISLPNYLEIIEKNNFADNIIEDVVEKFGILFHRVLLKKKVGILLFLIQKYRLILETLNQQQRSKQEKVLGLFEEMLHDSISINNKEGFHIILDEFIEVIELLDKENRLSEGFMKFIINIFSDLFSRCVKEKQNELIFSCINRLINLQKTLSIVNKKTTIQIDIIESLFQAGLDAIENHNEDIICNVSNHLGWVGKNSIENSNGEILQFVLTKATIMYNISIDLEVSKKTIIFIGTLFIVLGGYIHSSQVKYLPRIKNCLNQLKDKRYLTKSRDLRLYESSKWNNLMNGNAKHHIETFSKSM